MTSLLIAHTPWSDAATLSGGSWTGGLPLNNVKTDKLSQVARSTDATNASTKLVADLGGAKALDCVVVGPTNLSAAYRIRVKGATSNAFSGGYDSGWINSGITAADVDSERGVNAFVLFASTQTYRWWSIELDDTANADGYVQIGRLFLPQTIRPSVNFAPGDGLGWEDQAIRTETLSGVENIRRRRNRRVFNFSISMIDQDEAFGSLYRFGRTVGFDKTVFVVPDPADVANSQARNLWGRIRAADPITQAQVSVASFGLTLSEVF